MSNPNVTFAPGQRLGNYELLLELAAGGTATVGVAVYRGAAGFERLVIIKRVHRHLAKDREFSAMLTDEARLASAIRHPNVAAVIDVVRIDEELILVMDYVDSVSLSQLAKEAQHTGARLPMAIVSRILVDTLTGLHEAHEAVDLRRQPLGIVHRDVSPQNIVVGVDGTARVIDFGIAKARSRIAQTRAGIIKGKCAYMAPEQVDGQQVDRRCDVFAAGIVLWETLTGRRLFRGDDEFDEMRRVMNAPIPPPSSVAPECSPEVDALLSHALARPVTDRFQTALAFARAIEHAIPPAPARLVSERVDALCGKELEYRHTRLAAILGDELEKLSPRSSRTTQRTAQAADEALQLAYQATVKLEVALPIPPPMLPPNAAPAARGAHIPSGTLRSGDARPTSAEGIEAPVREAPAVHKRSLMPILVVVTLASLALGAGGALAWLSREQGPSPVPSSAANTGGLVASSSPSSLPSSPSSAPPLPAVSLAPTVQDPLSAPSASNPVPPPTAAPRSAPRPGPTPASELKKNPYGP